MNLLNETLDCLKVLEIDEKDVYGAYDGKTLLNWNDFKKLAKDINYDNGYGCQEINQSLLVYTEKQFYIAMGMMERKSGDMFLS